MKGLKITLSILVLLSCLNIMTCQMPGGYFEGSADTSNKEKLLSYIKNASNNSNLSILQIPSNQVQLVSYSRQVVAGLNHLVKFKLGAGKFECFVIYESLDGKFEITHHKRSQSQNGLGEYCD